MAISRAFHGSSVYGFEIAPNDAFISEIVNDIVTVTSQAVAMAASNPYQIPIITAGNKVIETSRPYTINDCAQLDWRCQLSIGADSMQFSIAASTIGPHSVDTKIAVTSHRVITTTTATAVTPTNRIDRV